MKIFIKRLPMGWENSVHKYHCARRRPRLTHAEHIQSLWQKHLAAIQDWRDNIHIIPNKSKYLNTKTSDGGSTESCSSTPLISS